MRLGRALWLSMNDHRRYSNATEAEATTNRLIWVMDELSKWKENTEFTPERFLTVETYEDTMRLCRAMPEFIDYVCDVVAFDLDKAGFQPRKMSQDPLERAFGDLRQRSGGTQNMTVMGLAYNLRSINENVLNGFKLNLDIDS